MSNLSIFNRSFWDLWMQKIFRNLASVKYQWMVLLYIPIIIGMFFVDGSTEGTKLISPTVGLGFLGGGFVTLATSRIIANTKLTNGKEDTMDTDR